MLAGYPYCRHVLFSVLALAGTEGLALGAKAETLLFDASWGGMDAADIAFVAEQRDGRYHGHLTIRTTGIARFLTGIDIDADGWGTVTAGGFKPASYSQSSRSSRIETQDRRGFPRRELSAVTTRNEERILQKLDARDIEPPPPVGDVLRRGVLDPVTGLDGDRTAQQCR